MRQYIDKTDVMAEIEKRLHKYEERYKELSRYEIWITAKKIELKIEELKSLRDFLNTLEMKGVDLEKEIKEQITKYYNDCEQKLKEMDDNDNDFSFMTLDNFAKHFYELGLKASKGELSK